MKAEKREVEIVVLSDAHLGTYGCHAKELHRYLKSVRPKTLILNGDIIDVWQFNKSYFPKAHMKVVKEIVNIISSGTPVYYITGNHDDMLRRFADFEMGSFKLVNKLVMEVDGKRMWFFHGDVFDLSMRSRRLAIIGGKSYDLLILLNRFINRILQAFGREKVSLSKTIKDSVKKAVKYVGDFEQTAANHAIAQAYDFVVCGHIHRPQMREMINMNGKVMYLNSGDWIENLTALEYNKGAWQLYEYNKDAALALEAEHESDNVVIENEKVLLENLAAEFNFMLAGTTLLSKAGKA